MPKQTEAIDEGRGDLVGSHGSGNEPATPPGTRSKHGGVATIIA